MKPRSRITVQPTQRLALTTTLAASIRVLQADALGLSRYLEEQAAENPALVVTRSASLDWTPRWKSALAPSREAPETAAPAPSLTSHALGLVASLRLSAQGTRIAEAFVDALEPSGWLGRPLPAIAQGTGAPLSEVEIILAQVQAEAEPAGLFARNLRECLRLQAAEAGELDAAMAAVLDRLDLVARGALDQLSRESGIAESVLRDRIGVVRGYDPKPGARFEPCAAPLREPDLIAERGAHGWVVSLNRSALPSLEVAPGRGPGRAVARELVRMVEGRNATLLAVGQDILARQTAALDVGIGALEPMTMAEVARSVGLHESTVSRVVAGTAVDTPRGTWWLRALFTQAVTEGGPSAGALRDRLARLVAAEDPRHPLSDAALALALAEGGAPVARRTVAKYRAMLNLPPAHRRRARR